MSGSLRVVHADLSVWRPPVDAFALVLASLFWDRDCFQAAARAVAPGGILGWEAFTRDHLRHRPGFREAWLLGDGEPASLLPGGFEVLESEDRDDGRSATRRLLARRGSTR